MERGEGPRLYGVDGREYIDFNMSHGATFLGHNHPATKAAIRKALDLGVVCAYETEHHQALARTICEVVPCAERVRYTNTGTESTLVALRMARKYTGKNKLVKFEGHFHGLHEFVMYNAHTGTGEYTAKGYIEPMVESAGVPEGMKDYVIVLPWNDMESLEMAFEQDGDDIAAVIMEPLNYNSGGPGGHQGVHAGRARDNRRQRHPAHLRRGAQCPAHRPRQRPGVLRRYPGYVRYGQGHSQRRAPGLPGR